MAEVQKFYFSSFCILLAFLPRGLPPQARQRAGRQAGTLLLWVETGKGRSKEAWGPGGLPGE